MATIKIPETGEQFQDDPHEKYFNALVKYFKERDQSINSYYTRKKENLLGRGIHRTIIKCRDILDKKVADVHSKWHLDDEYYTGVKIFADMPQEELDDLVSKELLGIGITTMDASDFENFFKIPSREYSRSIDYKVSKVKKLTFPKRSSPSIMGYDPRFGTEFIAKITATIINDPTTVELRGNTEYSYSDNNKTKAFNEFNHLTFYVPNIRKITRDQIMLIKNVKKDLLNYSKLNVIDPKILCVK